ncbi:MAG: B12-binding domain-containing radical SAM protein [Ignavibacterium album]|uniref:B12-binding domain-containing radical SAM protein n=1 Tax=Ignavibacterium album TaxID=591197 RepID=UPI0026ECB840|nr:radical SAM protein [Ignavibacterium album]MCX8106963.1 B12-binding domain-containing radical SAM protein [Ignavibacterium album]
MKNKIILFNPKSARWKHRIPNSILQVGASIHNKFDYVIVDGNLEKDCWSTIISYLQTDEFKYFAVTVMPGMQLQQAIPLSKRVRELYPEIIIIWGGYFPSNQYKVCLESGFVDFIINGPGDEAFPQLIEALNNNDDYSTIQNLILKKENEITKTSKAELFDQDKLPPLPYDYLNKFYPIKRYLGKTFLGNQTAAYHSSVGCPFTCSFCAVVPIYEARWKGKSANNIFNDLMYLKEKFLIDAVEFHDNNFFVSEKRTVEFSELIKNKNISWWGEGRIDTIDKYKDESLRIMREAGCKMIFFGAETGNDEILRQMDKGGNQSRAQIIGFARRLRKFGIIPEYSFVLGLPAENEQRVFQQINDDINFIKEIKSVNPDTEIIIYVYSPVPTEGSELYERVIKTGFKFPKKLEDWLNPEWENFDLRKNPLTPWLKPYMIDRIKNFETVINGYYPTVSDYKLTSFQRKVIKFFSGWRYKSGFYFFPYELKLLQRFWLKYRQPEIEGFYAE